MNQNKMSRCVLSLLITSFVAASIADAQDANREFKFDSAVLQVVEIIEVPAAATGPLQELKIKNGAMIQADQVLATIDDADIQIQLRQSQIELEMIKAQAESEVDINFALKSKAVVMADLRRAQQSNLRYAGVVSDREMDRLKLLVEQSTAELEKIRFDKSIVKMQQKLKAAVVEKNQNELHRHQIRSKISGQIVEIAKRPGEWVNVADPVVKVMRMDRLRVEHYLPAKFADSELTGAMASFTAVGSDVKFKGQVVFVNPEINPLNATVQVWVEFENGDLKMRPGMKGRVVIEKRPAEKLVEQTTSATSRQ